MDIISRSEWGARRPRNRNTTSWGSRREFVVHYSLGPTSQSPRSIQDFHMDGRGWSDVGYNFLVDVDGRVYEGRGWLTIGAHATGHNTSGIGVCFIGEDGDATAAARSAIRAMYDEACRRAGRTLAKRGHRDVGSTSCPGDELARWVHAGMPAGPVRPYKWDGRAPDGSPLLAAGDSGWAVRDVQHALLAVGEQLPEFGADGDFGDETEAAVRSFQRRRGLAVDGVYGPDTARNLRNALADRRDDEQDQDEQEDDDMGRHYYGQLNGGPGALTVVGLHPGDVTHVGFLADNGRQGLPPAALRVAVHYRDETWDVHRVVADSTKPKAVVKLTRDAEGAALPDGFSVEREDDGAVVVGWDASS